MGGASGPGRGQAGQGPRRAHPASPVLRMRLKALLLLSLGCIDAARHIPQRPPPPPVPPRPPPQADVYVQDVITGLPVPFAAQQNSNISAALTQSVTALLPPGETATVHLTPTTHAAYAVVSITGAALPETGGCARRAALRPPGKGVELPYAPRRATPRRAAPRRAHSHQASVCNRGTAVPCCSVA